MSEALEGSAQWNLVLRSKRGDRGAFEELVRYSARAVFARLYLETSDAHVAEDLTQETFLLAWRSIGKLTDPDSFRPWLYTIAQSAAVDAARRKSRQKRDTGRTRGDLALARVVDGGLAPLDTAQGHEERQRALALLRSLPDEYRQVLTLRYLAGADYETIGRQLAITNGSLRGLLNRGLALLRKQMSHNEVGRASARRENESAG